MVTIGIGTDSPPIPLCTEDNKRYVCLRCVEQRMDSVEYPHFTILRKGTRGSFRQWNKNDYDLAVTRLQILVPPQDAHPTVREELGPHSVAFTDLTPTTGRALASSTVVLGDTPPVSVTTPANPSVVVTLSVSLHRDRPHESRPTPLLLDRATCVGHRTLSLLHNRLIP